MISRHLTGALRTIARAPASSLFIVVVLTVSIGASAAIFALIDAALLKPLPYPQPDRLVALTYTFEGRVVPRASEAKFAVWREFTRTVAEPAAVGFRSVEMETADGLQRVRAGAVSATFFGLFGAPFVAGRPFTDHQDGQVLGGVVVLSHHLWQQRFGEDPAILGRRLVLDGQARTVIGIVARAFETSLLGDRPDLWVPLQLDSASLEHPPFLSAYGRLQPGVSLRQAHDEDRRAAEEFRRRYPGVMGESDSFAVQPFSEVVLDDLRQPLGLLAGAVALLLALGCTNVAGLLLGQMSARRREMAVRMALGGSRRQIATQLLAESAVLTGVAGGLGLTLGLSGARALAMLAPGTIPRLPDGAASLELDARLGAFVCLLSLLLTVACMVLPMLTSLSTSLASTLRGNGATAHGADRRTNRARALVVASQIAIAALLSVGAALLGRTWWELQTADRGFNRNNVATMRASLGNRDEDLRSARVSDIVNTAVERLAAVPGVVEAAATCCLPFESDWLTSAQIVGSDLATSVDDLLSERRISPSYFDVLEIPVVRGRAFGPQDLSPGPGVAIINQAMARRFWPEQDPLGAQVRLFPGRAPDDQTVVRTIVGVVADVRDGLAMAERPRPTVYVPLAQVTDAQQEGSVAWIIRHRGASAYDQAAAERAIRSATGGRPVFDVGSLEAVRANATADTTLRATLLALFSGAALLLAVIGVYGAVSATVRQRWHELGIRLAVGASPARLRRRVVREVLRIVTIGTAAGLLGAFWGSRAVGAFLFDVSARDPVVFTCVALVVAMLAFLAAWIPANRVVRLNVVDVLRGD